MVQGLPWLTKCYTDTFVQKAHQVNRIYVTNYSTSIMIKNRVNAVQQHQYRAGQELVRECGKLAHHASNVCAYFVLMQMTIPLQSDGHFKPSQTRAGTDQIQVPGDGRAVLGTVNHHWP